MGWKCIFIPRLLENVERKSVDMKCPICGTDNPANARFCGNCRQSLVEESTAGSVGVETAELPAVGFPAAVKLGFQRYVDFSGRSSRAEFWWWSFFSSLGYIVAAIIDLAAGDEAIFSSLWGLALFIPALAISVRRLHDINRSAWWLLLHLVFGIGSMVLLIWACMPSKADPQKSLESPVVT
jgi:uncharacterized membrane protein YhaH (DUF805 family)